MKTAPGTYALILRSSIRNEIEIGRWGRLRLKHGYYVYVGSAYGPGGVRARVARHFRKAKRNHWHIDYLREEIDPVCAWCSYEPTHLEHNWARAFSQTEGVSCIQGFGCSDCSCGDGHLFFMSRTPDSSEVLGASGAPNELYEFCHGHAVCNPILPESPGYCIN